MRIEVIPHDPAWQGEFSAEAQRIRRALGKIVVRLHHIGSTAIPGLSAKPIIDLLLEVEEVAELDDRSADLQALGYEVMGEFGIPGRRYFRKNNASGVRTHQLHAFKADAAQVERHLAFRDYLIAHPAEAGLYSELKQKLAQTHPGDIEAYMDGKDPFIKEHQARAIAWRSSRPARQAAR